jgi:hypothetical protein
MLKHERKKLGHAVVIPSIVVASPAISKDHSILTRMLYAAFWLNRVQPRRRNGAFRLHSTAFAGRTGSSGKGIVVFDIAFHHVDVMRCLTVLRLACEARSSGVPSALCDDAFRTSRMRSRTFRSGWFAVQASIYSGDRLEVDSAQARAAVTSMLVGAFRSVCCNR